MYTSSKSTHWSKLFSQTWDTHSFFSLSSFAFKITHDPNLEAPHLLVLFYHIKAMFKWYK